MFSKALAEIFKMHTLLQISELKFSAEKSENIRKLFEKIHVLKKNKHRTMMVYLSEYLRKHYQTKKID